MQQQFANLENEYSGRLGVFAINTRTGATVQHRANECFPFCSTFKLMLVSAILKRNGGALMEKKISINQGDLVSWSTVTEDYVGSVACRGQTV